MKKNSTKGYVILGILFALVSIIAFAVPTSKTATFWIAYVFTAAAFAAQIGIWRTALGKEETLKSKFLGFPVVHIGIVYAVIQVIALAVFMFVPTLPAWSAIVVCSVIAGASAVCMISAEAGRNEIERVEAKVQKKVFYIRELQADVELLADNETDTASKTALSQLAEKIRFSDPMSNEQLADLENKISTKVARFRRFSSCAAFFTSTAPPTSTIIFFASSTEYLVPQALYVRSSRQTARTIEVRAVLCHFVPNKGLHPLHRFAVIPAHPPFWNGFVKPFQNSGSEKNTVHRPFTAYR